MTQTEALKLALEALEGSIAWDATRNYLLPYRVRDPMHEAIAAIKEALASVPTSGTSQERVDETAKQRHEQAHAEQLARLGWQYFECPACGSEGARAFPKPEQEPVAWRFRSGTWFNREVHWRYVDTLEGTEGLLGLQPLYTTPPQRKPLTDEELYKVFPAIATYHEANKTLYRSIARAIEAAHGIKE